MVKVQGLYKNVVDLDEFEDYYTKVIIPKVLSVPGVLKMEYTTLYHATSEQPEGLSNIHVLTETYFDSMEEMRRILSSEEGVAITKLITALADEEELVQIHSYIAQEKVIYAPKWIERKTEGEIIEIIDLDNLDLS
jgi:uncharacterized protein (TIGR02118 family)